MTNCDFFRLSSSHAAFIGHALLENDLSTRLIGERLYELGLDWPSPGVDPGCITWLEFPVIPQDGGQSVQVKFHVLPILGPDFIQMMKMNESGLRNWVFAAATKAIHEALHGGASVSLGWGALTKNVTRHGVNYLGRGNDFENNQSFTSTHGDSGTVALVLMALSYIYTDKNPGILLPDARTQMVSHKRITIIGAKGVIGEALSRQIYRVLKYDALQLVGRADEPNAMVRNSALRELQVEVRGNVTISQDHRHACLDHDSDLVIVTTNDASVHPEYIPERALVIDLTAPAACNPEDSGWKKRNILLVKAESGWFTNSSVLPQGFGFIKGVLVDDVGAGGKHALWGCALETIARAAYKPVTRHVIGHKITMDEVAWCAEAFTRLGIEPHLLLLRK